MDEIGIVRRTDGVLAMVGVAKKSSCTHCTESSGSCNTDGSEALIEAVNNVRAAVGQKVRVIAKPLTYLQGTLLLYALPAISLILGALFGRWLVGAGYLKNFDLDIMSAVFGFGGLIISLILNRIISARLEKKTELKPVIEEILEE